MKLFIFLFLLLGTAMQASASYIHNDAKASQCDSGLIQREGVDKIVMDTQVKQIRNRVESMARASGVSFRNIEIIQVNSGTNNSNEFWNVYTVNAVTSVGTHVFGGDSFSHAHFLKVQTKFSRVGSYDREANLTALRCRLSSDYSGWVMNSSTSLPLFGFDSAGTEGVIGLF